MPDETTRKHLALRQALLDTGTPLRRFAESWHPADREANGDYERGYAHAMVCAAFVVAEAAGVDTAPYRETP